MQGDNKPWVAPRARIFPGAESATETSAVATDYATVPGGRSNLFGFSPSQGRVDSDEDSDEDGEVLRVDNESIDDEDQLAISNLGIPPGVVESLAKRGITQLFPIQVCAALRQPIHVLLDFGPRPFAASLCKC
jgi:ATP-dependent RNA helicase DDX21